MDRFFKFIALMTIVLLSVIISASSNAATLDTAHRYYTEKDFKSASSEYGALLTLNWPKANLGEMYDAYTDCLVITGNYNLANAKIDYILNLLPDDPMAPKLAARKIQIAHELGVTTQTAALVSAYSAKYGAQSPYYSAVQKYATVSAGTLASSGVQRSAIGLTSLNTAQQSGELTDYAGVVSSYEMMLKDQSTTNAAEIYDGLTEALMITGKYAEANDKINTYVAEHATDPLCEKLVARKVQLACYVDDFTSAAQLAKQYLAKYNHLSDSGLKTQRLLVDALGRSGQYQERVDFIENELKSNPSHPLYAELRKAQADSLLNGLKKANDARLKYVDALNHSAEDSEIYETCAYRISDILQGQARSAVKIDPQKAAELTSQSLQYLIRFVDHPGADKNIPVNSKRRIAAFKRLKRFEDMEREATRYLSDDNATNYNEVVAVKSILGEYSDFQNIYGATLSTEDQQAIRTVKAAYYDDNYTSAGRFAQDFLASHAGDSAARQLAQRLYIGAMAKAHGTREVVACVIQALNENTSHPMYADFRRAQADALWDMKQTSNSRAMFIDAMAHTSNDSDVYDWCCFRAGSAAMTESNAPGLDAKTRADLRTIGRHYMQLYLTLPSKDRIYPSNVIRRMTAWNFLKKNDEMELEAARYLADRADYSEAVYLHIQRILSVNRSTRKNTDPQGAMAAFEQLRLRENDLSDVNSKVSIGISMIKSATYFASQGSPKDQVEKLRESGRKFLQDAVKDGSLKLQRRMDAYYFLQDWAGLKAAADVELARTAATDSATRAELFNWIGIALAQQKPQDMDGALASFDNTIAEYEKNPQAVKDRAVLAAQWAMWLWEIQKNDAKAQVYLDKVKAMPDSVLKAKVIAEYQPLINK